MSKHASHLVTTSIAEGFGLSFLEPVALGKPLFGRDLPEITSDFRRDGLTLGALYRRLLVPAGWIDQPALRARLHKALAKTYRAYQRPLDEDLVADAWHALTDGAHFDFGNLPEPIQRKVLARAIGSPGTLLIDEDEGSRPLAEWLARALEPTATPAAPGALEHFSLSNYRQRLQDLYTSLQESSPDQPTWLDKERVLDQFLRPDRFHFLRT